MADLRQQATDRAAAATATAGAGEARATFGESLDSVRRLCERFGVGALVERSSHRKVSAARGSVSVEERTDGGVTLWVDGGRVEAAFSGHRVGPEECRTFGRLAEQLPHLPPGRYVLRGGAGPARRVEPDAWPGWPALAHTVARSCGPAAEGLHCELLVERRSREIGLCDPGGRAQRREDRWGRATCFVGDEAGRGLGKASAPRGRAQDQGVSASDLEELRDRALQQASRLRGSSRTPAGTFDLVLQPDVAGAFVHELVGHMLESDNVARAHGLELGIGTRLSPELLSVAHTSRPVRGWAGAEFDDEGAATSELPLLRQGVVEAHLGDRRHSREQGRTPAGNGWRSAFCEPLLPRLSTLSVATGQASSDELYDVEEALVVEDTAGAVVDPASGRARLSIREARLLRGGRQAGTFSGGVVACGVLDALGRIDALGDTPSFRPSICSKAGQLHLTAEIAPAIRLRAMAVR